MVPARPNECSTACSGAQGLGDPGALGSALLRVVLERHDGLPAGAEAGLLLAAAAAYEVDVFTMTTLESFDTLQLECS